MSMSYMEMIYIDSEDQARQTNVRAAMESNEATWKAFRSAKQLDVPAGEAKFLLDYYNRNGDLADTIGLSEASYKRITGHPVLSDAEYREIDREFWQRQMQYIAPRSPELPGKP